MSRHLLIRWVLPVLVSAGLVAWLVWRISPSALLGAAEGLNWPALAALTAAMILTVYGWDVVCVRWLYALPDRDLSYRTAADVRANSYLWSAFNYGAGQGVLAWKLAQMQNTTLLGSKIDAAETEYIPIALATALGMVAVLAILWKFLPARRRERIVQTRWGNWLVWWQWRHSGILILLRLVYFGIMIAYAAIALRVCGLARDFEVVCGAVPLVLIFDALPSVSGFGTRHAAFEALLKPSPAERGIIFHFATFWSAGLLIGRAGIGLANWWLVPLFARAGENS